MLRDEIYRIAREAMRNAFRYAKAQKIEAEITYGDSEFLLHVRDDGKGIDPEVANRGRAGHWGPPVCASAPRDLADGWKFGVNTEPARKSN